MQIIVAGHNGPQVARLQDYTKRPEFGGHGATATGESVGNGLNFCWHDKFHAKGH